MKSLTGFALFVAATFITAGNVSAQAVEKANVPFSFTVGNQTVPAGTYTISTPMSSPSLLAIDSRDNSVHVMTLGQSDQDNLKHANVLIFDEVGGKYYLRDIRSSSSVMNIHFPASKAEKRAKAQAEEAGLLVNDPVLIALN